MNQTSMVAVLVVLVIVFAGTTIYFAVSKNAFAPSANQTVPTQSMAGKIPGMTSQTATSNQTVSVNETVDWKTYVNMKYKFSIQYPADYQMREETITDAPKFDLSGQPVFAVNFAKKINGDLNPDSDNFIDISVNKNAPKGGGVPNGLDYNPSSVKTVIINGIKMSKLTENLYTAEKKRNRILFA